MGPTGFNKLGLDLGEGEPIGLGLEKNPSNFEMAESSNQTKDWLRVQDMSHVHYEGQENSDTDDNGPVSFVEESASWIISCIDYQETKD